MAVVLKNHNGHSTKQRFIVTLICLTLATTLVSGISFYVDSASVNEWSNQIEVGPVSMMVSGTGVKDVLPDIVTIPGITNVSGLDSAHGYLTRKNVIYGFETSGNVYALSEDYLEKFPTTFTLFTGRWPQNESEIAIPQSLAEQSFIGVGWTVNYSFGYSYPVTTLSIVGTYQQSSGDLYSHYFYSSIGVVVASNLDANTTSTRAYLSVDISPISPYDANGALTYLSNIAENIRELYPGYPEEVAYSGFTVFDYLSTGIRSYINWRDTVRSEQIFRAAGVILIVVFMVILAVQYNLSDRKLETSYFRARGATERRIELIAIRELLLLAALSGLLSTFMGLIISRLALASTGYLQFNLNLFFTSPILMTQDTFLLILLLTFGLPSLVYLGIKFVGEGQERIEEGTGKLSKLSKGMKMVRWDLGILSIALLLMFVFFTSGAAVQRNPIYSLILPYLPVPIYIAVGSLVMKGLGRSAEAFSKVAGKPLGKIPASLGIRRISRSSKSAGLVIMVIVLAITLSWNNAITDQSLPETRVKHAQFTIGGDIVFHMKKGYSVSWSEFTDNVTAHDDVLGCTMVSMKKLFLSSGYTGSVDFVIMQPDEYRFVGYDYLGNRLNESGLNDIMEEMAANPTAAVMTRDIASEYQVEVGDTIRAFKSQTDTDYFSFTVLAIIDALTHPVIPESTYIPESAGYSVGSRLVWVNSMYVGEKLDLVDDTHSYLTVATKSESNDTRIALDLLSSGGEAYVYTNDWATVDNEYDSYINGRLYKMDRAVDSMLSITSTLITVGVMLVYATESIQGRKRDNALLRAMGTDGKILAKIQSAELLFIVLFSILILLLYGPLFIANSLIASLSVYTSWSFVFPVPMFVVIPWTTLLAIIGFFLACILGLIVIIAVVSVKTDLREALNNSWALGGPLVESENS